MLNNQLLNPRSIVVAGASDNTAKPGGKLLKNLLTHHYTGQLHVLHPTATSIQGVPAVARATDLPAIDLAILAIPAAACIAVAQQLIAHNALKALVVLSAGFAESGPEGALIEKQLLELTTTHHVSLIGPNCIGVLTTAYAGLFTAPIPTLHPQGVELVSASGATAVFLLEAGIPLGLRFASIYSVGNSTQNGVEDVLQHLDQTYIAGQSPQVKMLYIEQIKNPARLLAHARSLYRKGCRIVAIKAGTTAAGERAAASHTGAMATPDMAVDALLRKARIIRCHGRTEMVTVAAALQCNLALPRSIAIITHAGGPGVMMADRLSQVGFAIPPLDNSQQQQLLASLHAGASTSNPIDILATGTAAQLAATIDYCELHCPQVDAMVVLFGSPGLTDIFEVIQVLQEKIKRCKKTIYVVLPSALTTAAEIAQFNGNGFVAFRDEVELAKALGTMLQCQPPTHPSTEKQPDTATYLPSADILHKLLRAHPGGFLPDDAVAQLLQAAGIPLVGSKQASNAAQAQRMAQQTGFPLVMKAGGLLHKSDKGGVRTGIRSESAVAEVFAQLMAIDGVEYAILQPQITGFELYAGARRFDQFGTLIFCGHGGILVEVLRDTATALSPLTMADALAMIERLRIAPVFEGVRRQQPIGKQAFADLLCKLSALVESLPEITEIDINPFMATGETIVAVDARINIEWKPGDFF